MGKSQLLLGLGLGGGSGDGHALSLYFRLERLSEVLWVPLPVIPSSASFGTGSAKNLFFSHQIKTCARHDRYLMSSVSPQFLKEPQKVDQRV